MLRYTGLCLALLLLSGCRQEQAAEAPRGQSAPVTTARVETVALAPLRDTLDAVGTVRTKTRMLIASKVQGYVREVRVRQGDQVEPGALLVTVDPRDLVARVDRARAALADAEMALDEVKTTQGEAEAALRAAEADHAYADATAARYQQLRQRDLIMAADLDVTHIQSYVGTAAPYNFNGLIRHYFPPVRQGSNVADIQVNLRSKGDRHVQSHDIAGRIRPALQRIGAAARARIKVAEVPPGPPVLQTLVAEVYGDDRAAQLDAARRILGIFEQTPGVVDVDWYVEDPQPGYLFVVDKEKAALSGISTGQLVETLRVALEGVSPGLAHFPAEKEDVPIVVRLPRDQRSGVETLSGLKLKGTGDGFVPISELARVTSTVESPFVYRKNLQRVVYVTGDVAGQEESPVYAILRMNEELDRLRLPDGRGVPRHVASQPFLTDRVSMKWDGEWQVTYEVFRDLGLAFAAVIVLIYILVVGWFRSFKTPLVIMAPIPLTLVGILPAHGLLGAFFTATSMIGFIAGAGIIVRNSIILVDFIELRRGQGMPLAEAVVDAGAVRFRPMLLTAAAVVVGASVILFDPIFQGLALSLMAGEVTSTLLSRMAVPVLYYMAER